MRRVRQMAREFLEEGKDPMGDADLLIYVITGIRRQQAEGCMGTSVGPWKGSHQVLQGEREEMSPIRPDTMGDVHLHPHLVCRMQDSRVKMVHAIATKSRKRAIPAPTTRVPSSKPTIAHYSILVLFPKKLVDRPDEKTLAI